MLHLALADAAARGAIVAVSAALLHGGSRTCTSLGWVAGLAIFPLDQPTRVAVAVRLGYGAVHSALLATAARATTGQLTAGANGVGISRSLVSAVEGRTLDSGCVGRWCGGLSTLFDPLFSQQSSPALGMPSLAAPAVGALLLAASSAFLLGEYAHAAAGRPSLLESRGAHALHFMLGFDGFSDAPSDQRGQEETEAETR